MAYFAHIGGFVFGLLAIKLFADERKRRAQIDRRGRAGRTIVLGVALLFIAVLAFLTLFVLLRDRTRRARRSLTGDPRPDLFGVIGALATPPDDR